MAVFVLCMWLAVFFAGTCCLIVGAYRLNRPTEEDHHPEQAEILFLLGSGFCTIIFIPLLVVVRIAPLLQDIVVVLIGGGPFFWGTLHLRAHYLYGRPQIRLAPWITFAGAFFLGLILPTTVIYQAKLPSWSTHIATILIVIAGGGYLALLSY